MVCSYDWGSNDEQIVLETWLKVILAMMSIIRSNAIVIDKSLTQYNGIFNAIAQGHLLAGWLAKVYTSAS